jgi:sulfite reductase (NADPH) hemoprotein beta-component
VRGRARRIARLLDCGKHKNAAVSERPKPENRTYMYVYDEYDQRIIEDRVIRPDAIWQAS